MNTTNQTINLTDNSLPDTMPDTLTAIEKLGLAMVGGGVLSFIVLSINGSFSSHSFWGTLGLVVTGSFIYFLKHFLKQPPGIRNNGIMFSGLSAGGVLAWTLGIVFTGFYILMYWFTGHNWETNTPTGVLSGMVHFFDPLSQLLRKKAADKYFMYGALYTLLVSIMGVRAILKYRHSRYQIVRTASVIFFQLIFAFLIPSFLAAFGEPEKYLNYFWPLSYNDLFPTSVNSLLTHQGKLAKFLLWWTICLSFVAVPILTYFYGKRWYCSWVCGCGGLANTLGDNWRQLSSKKLIAWKVERVTIYSVLVLITATTAVLWLDKYVGGAFWGDLSGGLKSFYVFSFGLVFSGVVGTGFYPILGTRIWCRFGCPQAAILGILQRFVSRFRITTNGSQCISCGNCSTYCEMGIDVRWYAQRGQNIVRASCVGCGMCSSVCPRGVLSLENGAKPGRINESFSLVNEIKGKSS